jgi:outer membrane protein OmpA-like peptidoglycan-associated protein
MRPARLFFEGTMRRPSTFASVSPLVLFSLALAASAHAQAAKSDAKAPAAKNAASTSVGLSLGGSSGAKATAPPVDETEARTLSLEEQNSITGSTGLLRTLAAGSGAAGTFRLHAMLDWFSQSSFLCSADYKCPIQPYDAPDAASRIGSSFGLSASLTDYLEAFAALRSYSNSNDRSRPEVFQVIGDANLGVKGFTPNPIAKLLSVGGAADMLLRGASGGTGIQGDATSFRLRALGTFDLRKVGGDGLPMRIHTNVGYLLDNSDKLVTDVEDKRKAQHDPRGRKITRVERFGLNINRVDQMQISLGLEGMFTQVRPFAEYTLGVPVNRQSYNCDANYVSMGDQCLGGGKRAGVALDKAGFSSLPSTLTLGVRVFPWLRGLSATAAFDIGTTGTSSFVEELAPTPVWDLWIGAGYAIDTQEPAPRVSIEKVAVAPRAELKIRGFVHENDKPDPISDAAVHILGRDLSGMATDPDGRFLSPPIEPGSYTLTVRADGYKDGQCSATVNAPAEIPEDPALPAVAPPPAFTDVDCALEALSRVGSVSGRVLDTEGMAPVVGATVKVADSKGKDLGTAVTDSIGAFTIDGLVPGAVIVKVEAADYILRAQNAEVRLRQDSKSDILVQKRPAKGDVEIAAKEIKIKKQILFETNSARINPASMPLVEEIADVMTRNPHIKRIEIQGHTDNTGSKDNNKTLSEQRAGAVRDALVALGIQNERLTAVGYGQEKPVTTNATPAGRDKNRRVQFLILEQEKPAPAKPAADKPPAENPAADEPKADKPKADKPKADKPAADKPKADKPKADKPKPAAKP